MDVVVGNGVVGANESDACGLTIDIVAGDVGVTVGGELTRRPGVGGDVDAGVSVTKDRRAGDGDMGRTAVGRGIDAVVGTRDRQILDGGVDGSLEVKDVGTGRRIVAIEDGRSVGARRPFDRDV